MRCDIIPPVLATRDEGAGERAGQACFWEYHGANKKAPRDWSAGVQPSSRLTFCDLENARPSNHGRDATVTILPPRRVCLPACLPICTAQTGDGIGVCLPVAMQPDGGSKKPASQASPCLVLHPHPPSASASHHWVHFDGSKAGNRMNLVGWPPTIRLSPSPPIHSSVTCCVVWCCVWSNVSM